MYATVSPDSLEQHHQPDRIYKRGSKGLKRGPKGAQKGTKRGVKGTVFQKW